LRQAYDYWQNQPDCSWFSVLTTHVSTHKYCLHTRMHACNYLGRHRNWKSGYFQIVLYVWSRFFTLTLSLRQGSANQVHTDDSPHQALEPKQESVRHSIVAHSLFPFPNTSLKERMTYSQGGLWLRFAVTECMCLRFSEKKLLDDARQSAASLPLRGCRLRDVRVSCIVYRVALSTSIFLQGRKVQVISAATGLMPLGAVIASTNLVSAQAFQPLPGGSKASGYRTDPCPGQTNLIRGFVIPTEGPRR